MSTPEINRAPEQPANAGCAAMTGYAAAVVAAVTGYDAATKAKSEYWMVNVCGNRAERIPDEMDIHCFNEMKQHRALKRLIEAARELAKHSGEPSEAADQRL